MELCERVEVPTVTHGEENWCLRMDERHQLDDMGTKCLRRMCDVTGMGRWKMEQVRRRAGLRKKISVRVARETLQLFGHVERISGKQLTRKVFESQVEGGRDRGGYCTRCLDGA